MKNNKYEDNEEIWKKNIVVETTNCNALSIANNVRIREKPDLNAGTKVLGKLDKYQRVTLVGCTDTEDTIENLKYPWYKVKMESGGEGWVFGGFVKIYFYDKDIEMLRKAFEKEGSEYSNQFLTPDNS